MLGRRERETQRIKGVCRRAHVREERKRGDEERREERGRRKGQKKSTQRETESGWKDAGKESGKGGCKE